VSAGEYRVGFDVGGTFDSEGGCAPLPNLPPDRLRRQSRRSKRGKSLPVSFACYRSGFFASTRRAIETVIQETSRERR
jgi:hypothetical protein